MEEATMILGILKTRRVSPNHPSVAGRRPPEPVVRPERRSEPSGDEFRHYLRRALGYID
jgi:hypothetical protein